MPTSRPNDDVLLPPGRLIGVGLTLSLPSAATWRQVAEWVSYQLDGGPIARDNPLLGIPLRSVTGVDLVDTGRDVADLGGGS